MRRNALTRITTVLYAVWLVVALGVQTASPCPTHDGVPVALAHGASHATMAGMAMAPDAHAHAPAHGSSPATARHACTCGECCCASGIGIGAPRAVRAPTSRIVATASDAPRAACVAQASRIARLLPFANGPPPSSAATA